MTKKTCLKFFARHQEKPGKGKHFPLSFGPNSKMMVSTCLLLTYVIASTSAVSPQTQLRITFPAFLPPKGEFSRASKSMEYEFATTTGVNNYFGKMNVISRNMRMTPRIKRNVRLRSSTEKVSKRTSSSTELHLKFKTFDEMLEHHAEVPLLINFYASFCGPCKLMKQELTSIRPILDTMGPTVTRVDEFATDNVNSGEGGDCVDADGDGSLDCSVDANDPGAQANVAKKLEATIDEVNPLKSPEKSRLTSTSTSSSSIKGTATTATNIQVALSRIQYAKSTSWSTTSTNDSSTNSSKPERKTMASNIPGKPTGIPIFHVNTERFPQVGAKNKIHGLPTLVLFWAGKEVWRQEGVASGEDILRELRAIECCSGDHEMDEEKSDVNRFHEVNKVNGSNENAGEMKNST